MRKMVLLFLWGACASVSFAGYDYTITGGFIGTLTLKNQQTLLMTGGGVNSLTAKDFSVLDVRSTAPFAVGSGGIGTLLVGDHSRLLLSGGEIYWFGIDDYARAVLSGGNISKLQNESESGASHIEIVCRDYDYNTGTKKLTGTWNVDNNKDGLFDIFKIQLVDIGQGYTPTYNILKFTIVPEPVSLLLLGLGGMVMRKRTAC